LKFSMGKVNLGFYKSLKNKTFSYYILWWIFNFKVKTYYFYPYLYVCNERNLIETTKIVPNGKSKIDQFKKKFHKFFFKKVETKRPFF